VGFSWSSHYFADSHNETSQQKMRLKGKIDICREPWLTAKLDFIVSLVAILLKDFFNRTKSSFHIKMFP
jgi:hypothetical protein